jgi:hypothetical protein
MLSADEICALLGCNVASSGNPLPTFRDNISVPFSRVKKSLHKPLVSLAGFLLFLDFLALEDRTDTLSRNVGKGLPFDAALYSRRAQISSASRRKPEITVCFQQLFYEHAWKPSLSWSLNRLSFTPLCNVFT